MVLHERLVNTPVMSLQTGAMIARAEQPIIDPRNLFVLAFYCSGSGLDVKPAVLHSADIRETGPMGFIVDSAERIMSPDDLVRLQEVMKFKFKLIDKEVVDDTGQKMGKVIDYTVDTESFYVMKLHVRPHFWQALQTAEVLIDRKQIKDVTDKQIIVYASTVKEKKKHPARAVVENPFRTPTHAQPEMIERHEG